MYAYVSLLWILLMRYYWISFVKDRTKCALFHMNLRQQVDGIDYCQQDVLRSETELTD